MPPYPLVSLTAQPTKTQFEVGAVLFGGEELVIMAGPCAVESFGQMVLLGRLMRSLGVSVLRGSAYKPRTSPYSFQGTGLQGLQWHREAQKEHGLLIETEVLDTRDVELVAAHVDILRVGARNMHNFSLLKEVGRCGKPVILKRGIAATVEEWLLSAEYISSHGNPRIILCERGIRTFETTTRYTLDLGSVAVVKGMTHLPVIVDPTHAAGRKDIVPALAKAAIAVGADGLLIEVHDLPEEALCDGHQALLPEECAQLMRDLRTVALAVGRSLR
jgi:3-deoxy-7-phosphoheptulonate synthase